MTIFFILSFATYYAMDDAIIPFHAVVGSICAVLFVIHVWINRQWLVSVGKNRKTGKVTKKTAWVYRIDIALIIVWGICILSAIPAVIYYVGGVESLLLFRNIHSITSTIGLILVIVHVIQHMRQIKSYFRRRKPA